MDDPLDLIGHLFEDLVRVHCVLYIRSTARFVT
jgi:hypothetical protein